MRLDCLREAQRAKRLHLYNPSLRELDEGIRTLGLPWHLSNTRPLYLTMPQLINASI
jgi:hypothetical protein